MQGLDLTTATNTRLLEALRRGEDQTAWGLYVERYRPVVVGFARRLGLSDSDAQDVAQNALLAFYHSYTAGAYERERGRLRDWLLGIARREVVNWHRKRRQAVAGVEPPDESTMTSMWEDEWGRHVLRTCVERVRQEVQPKTMEAFDLFAVRGLSARAVAEQLAMSENAVFGAKRRVLNRLRELRRELMESW